LRVVRGRDVHSLGRLAPSSGGSRDFASQANLPVFGQPARLGSCASWSRVIPRRAGFRFASAARDGPARPVQPRNLARKILTHFHDLLFLGKISVKQRLMAAVCCALCGWATLAQAHFVWLVVEAGPQGQVLVAARFSEAAEAGEAELIEKIAHTQVHARGADGALTLLKLTPSKQGDEGQLQALLAGPAPVALEGSCHYGVVNLGKDGSPKDLHYFARFLDATKPGWESQARSKLPLEIVPRLTSAGLELEVLYKGQSLAETKVVAQSPNGESQDLTATEGRFKLAVKTGGQYVVRARMAEDIEGELNGKVFKQRLRYATLVIRLPEPKSAAAGPAVKSGSVVKTGSAVAALKRARIEMSGQRLIAATPGKSS